MKKLIFILILFILPLILNAQNINGRLSSSIYTFERFDTANVSDTYFRSFQSLSVNMNKSNLSLRARLNFETNISNALDNDPRLRLYNLYLEARSLFNLATIKIGRQALYSSIAGGVYDGFNLKLKYQEYSIEGFYGGNVPAYQKLKFTDDWSNNFVLGGKFVTTILPNFNIILSYINKNFKPQSYFANRLNNALEPITILIENKSNQYKYASAQVSYRIPNMFNVNTRFDYDLNFKTASKFEISGRYEQIEKLGINVYYNYREPRVRYNSIFSVFNYGNTQEFEGGIDYQITPMITAFSKFGNVTYNDDNSQRLTLGINSNFGSISYRKTFGYAGELDAISIYTAHSLFEGLVTPSFGISHTSYKLSENAAKNNLTSILAGVNIRPWTLLSFDLQGQFFNNIIYKNDYRFLFKINYWFNTNLDLI
ncbi:hypothetical protein ACFLS9_05940 [Bacteroidota bacterium]